MIYDLRLVILELLRIFQAQFFFFFGWAVE
jgi:hypothetical protein